MAALAIPFAVTFAQAVRSRISSQFAERPLIGFASIFCHDGNVDWFEGMEGAFLRFVGVSLEVLLDDAKALVEHHDPVTREVRFNERLHAFARYWGFKPRACAPYRARTKGKSFYTVWYYDRLPNMKPLWEEEDDKC